MKSQDTTHGNVLRLKPTWGCANISYTLSMLEFFWYCESVYFVSCVCKVYVEFQRMDITGRKKMLSCLWSWTQLEADLRTQLLTCLMYKCFNRSWSLLGFYCEIKKKSKNQRDIETRSTCLCAQFETVHSRIRQRQFFVAESIILSYVWI